MKITNLFRRLELDPPKPKSPPEQSYSEIVNARAEEGFKKLPIGSKFVYLGREMIVIEHKYFNDFFKTWPKLSAEYADDQGEIHTHEFDPTTILKFF